MKYTPETMARWNIAQVVRQLELHGVSREVIIAALHSVARDLSIVVKITDGGTG